jgi:hypothetical protein
MLLIPLSLILSRFNVKLLIAPLLILALSASGQASKVTLTEDQGSWKLLVNGSPYYINGAGGSSHLEELKQMGGNTIRTWSVENAQEILDEAQKKGLKVMMGLWVQHERHGFDYDNEARVKSQLETFRRSVKKLKDHPALLIWCIGNEYELNYTNPKVWSAVNDIARMIHQEDPNHPTATVTAGTNDEKLAFVMNELTEIDIYGINTYGDIGNVHTILERGHYKGPYMITEWGPTGHWEILKTMWGASIEQTSTEKATTYRERYQKNIAAYPQQCIGSFAFLWGHKQEYTSTWYGLFTEDGKPTEALDQLQYSWTGSYPENRAPSIDSIHFSGKDEIIDLVLEPGSINTVQLLASDKNKDALNYNWELYPESTDLKTGGDSEGKPPIISGRIKGRKTSEVVLRAPIQEGRYRLFVFVDDGTKVAYMNVPFYVEATGEVNKIQLKKQKLEQFEH